MTAALGHACFALTDVSQALGDRRESHLNANKTTEPQRQRISNEPLLL